MLNISNEPSVIKKEDLVVGRDYDGDGRNIGVAVWIDKVFTGLRYKFGDRFIDEEYH